MPQPASSRLTVLERRRALRLANYQGALWNMGNGLTSGVILYYLTLDLDAEIDSIFGWILALPALIGIPRILAPALIQLTGGNLKRFTIALSFLSYAALAAVPTMAIGSWSEDVRVPEFLIWTLSIHYFAEALGSVALWAWIGELAPTRIRGRYLARRQRWQLGFLIPTLLAGGLFADYWRNRYADTSGFYEFTARLGYVVPFAVGVALLLASLIPLCLMPAAGQARRSWRRLGDFARPFFDNVFARLVLAGCWISASNGLTQGAQIRYPRYVLELGVLPLAVMLAMMRLGQMGLAGPVGRFCDRYGNRPVLLASQAVVAFGLVFFLLATPEQPWWITGAWLAWSAYVGLNICLNNLTLKLAPPGLGAAYVAVYFALTSLAYAAGAYVGDDLLREMRHQDFYLFGAPLTSYKYMFCVGWITRSIGVLMLLAVIEPGAWSWSHILQSNREQRPDPALLTPPPHPLD